ncbi:DUF3822 family protein [Pararhodonellum marinum]|uniref:DUF3822 family protein n=1 Tax=Pararhodonellum marinum TaxID=2755358 RepID=UPI0018900FE4|nr:DUF3822 family protein [Pararhodonellum marinum]
MSLFLYDQDLVIMAKNANDTVIAVHEYFFKDSTDFLKFLSEDTLLNASNTQGKLFVFNDAFNLVPGVLFDPMQKSTYLNFNTDLDPDTQEVFYDGVDSNNIQVVGSVDKTLLKLLDEILPDMEVYHGALPVLDFLLRQRQDMVDQTIWIMVHQSHVFLASFKNHELVLFNRFPVRDNKELLKYLFIAIQQLDFDRLHCRINVIGPLEQIGADIDHLRDYFKNLHFPNPTSNQNYLPGVIEFQESKRFEAYWTI